jgi:hypothetical protein
MLFSHNLTARRVSLAALLAVASSYALIWVSAAGPAAVEQPPASNTDRADVNETDVPAVVPEIEPDWMNNLAPGEFCGTFQRYLAGRAAGGEGDTLAGTCPGNGPCDDPPTRDASIPTSETPIKTYRLSIHVFCNGNGTSCAANQQAVDDCVAWLNDHYAPWRIQFVYESEFINDNKYYVLSSNEERGMKRRYADSPASKLNIYITDTGGTSWGTFPWDSRALTKQGGIVLHYGHLFGADPIPVHEVGHCLGLWHTFHGVSEVPACSDCYEPAGRSAEVGDTTGDFVSETAPTPRNYYCTDPAGNDGCSGLPWGATSLTNFMGYGWFCASEFTPQQAGRMHCWTEDVLSGWLQ